MPKTSEAIEIRPLSQDDPPVIAAAFASIGSVKPEAQYRLYLEQEVSGSRTSLVATVNGKFAGYVTINWRPSYPAFAELGIPEIQDLNVLPAFRRRGIASRLLDVAEAQVARAHSVVGIGVGCMLGITRPSDCMGCGATFRTAVALPTATNTSESISRSYSTTILYCISQSSCAPSFRSICTYFLHLYSRSPGEQRRSTPMNSTVELSPASMFTRL